MSGRVRTTVLVAGGIFTNQSHWGFPVNPARRKRGNSKETSLAVLARSCHGMFMSGSFHLGWKAEQAGRGMLGAWAVAGYI